MAAGPGAGGTVHATLDTHELVRFVHDLKIIGGPELVRAYAKALWEAAQPAVAYERGLWAGHSTRIPGTVRARAFPGSVKQHVSIFAGGTSTTPHAQTLEGYDSGRPRRHPVFARTLHGRFNLAASQTGRGDWTWVAQVPPAQIIPKVVDAEADAMAERVIAVVEEFAARVGHFA